MTDKPYYTTITIRSRDGKTIGEIQNIDINTTRPVMYQNIGGCFSLPSTFRIEGTLELSRPMDETFLKEKITNSAEPWMEPIDIVIDARKEVSTLHDVTLFNLISKFPILTEELMSFAGRLAYECSRITYKEKTNE